MRVIAVDDEVLALRRVQLFLANMPGVEHVGEAKGCAEAHEQIIRLRPDVVLLDVQMRDGTGFDLIDRLPACHLPLVIFVSAFDQYAVRAFETSATDYVLKPVEFERLRDALGRAQERLGAGSARQQLEEMRLVVAALRQGMRGEELPRYETEFWIRKNVSGFDRVAVESIEWVSSEDDYVRLHTRANSFLMRGSIRGLLSRLDPILFTRIHRKVLVRTSAIREIRSPRFGALEVILDGGQQLCAGRVYAKELRRMAVLREHQSGRAAS
jgi:DNA-binding LytR/AlgR family response regulator